MIEKLEPIKAFNCSDTPQAKMQHHNYHNDCINKINELVDAVNELQKDYDNVCVWVGEQKLNYNPDTTKGLSTLVEEPEPADPYAEQRKWIGKLCWFWDDDKKDGSYGVLGYIKEGWKRCYVQKGHYFAYEHCEPASEDLIYKGE